MKLTEEFLDYCTYQSRGQPRKYPLTERTVGRYRRGLKHVEKIIGHAINEDLTEQDQVDFMSKIGNYAQGTRRVDTQIFQRFIAWGIKNRRITCDNLIVGKEDTIIGPDTPTSYIKLTKTEIGRFFERLQSPKLRIAFGLMYYGGLTTAELAYVEKKHLIDGGLVFKRLQRNETRFVPLPEAFMVEVREHAQHQYDKLLPQITDDYQGRHDVNMWYEAAQVETQALVGTNLKDLRIAGIRHTYDETQDMELTVLYAGASDKKQNWVESFLDHSAKELVKVAKKRRYHDKQKIESRLQ